MVGDVDRHAADEVVHDELLLFAEALEAGVDGQDACIYRVQTRALVQPLQQPLLVGGQLPEDLDVLALGEQIRVDAHDALRNLLHHQLAQLFRLPLFGVLIRVGCYLEALLLQVFLCLGHISEG